MWKVSRSTLEPVKSNVVARHRSDILSAVPKRKVVEVGPDIQRTGYTRGVKLI